MRHLKKKLGTLMTVICLTSVLVTACGGVTEEMLASRESAITMMEHGDYEGAVATFNELVENAKKVTDFELDILKYRAEAEFILEDYDAALHTYRTLMEVDKERPEYCYMASMALSRAGQMHDAKNFLDSGKGLDEKHEAPGFFEASLAYAEGYMAAGESEIAAELYQKLIEDGFGTTAIYNRLVLISMDQGEYEQALTFVAKGMALTDAEAVQELKFNEAVCYEYLGEFKTALELFKAYETEFGSDERVAHEIAFLETR